MRPIFCGNFEYDARQSELERLFRRYGRVERVDMKSGYAFIYMEDERDGEDAIRGLDRKEFGRKGRRLRVEWTKKERGIKRPGDSRRSSSNLKPSKTLFVINFDPYNTRTRDLERHFDPHGKVLNIRIRRNFAFIQFETQEDASRALDATNMSKLMDRIISVEYAIRDDDERRNGYSPDRRSRDRSTERRKRDKGRSPSPHGRERGSPDYGGRGPISSPYRRDKDSPEYGRGPSPRHEPRTNLSPSPYRRERPSPRPEPRDSRRSSSHRRERVSVDYARGSSPRPESRDVRSPSPYKRERVSPDHARDPSPRPEPRDERSPSPYNTRERDYTEYGRRTSADYGRNRSLSPRPEPRDNRSPTPSPYREERTTSPMPNPKDSRSPSPYREERTSPGPDLRDSHSRSPSPYRGERSISDNRRGGSPRDSPDFGRAESPANDRYYSQSPPQQERSLSGSRSRSQSRSRS